MRFIGPQLLLLCLIGGLAATRCSSDDGAADPSPTDTGVTVEPDAGFEADAAVGDPDAGFAELDTCVRSDPVNVTPDPACNASFTAILRGTVQDQDGMPFDSELELVAVEPEVRVDSVGGPGSQMCIEQQDGPPLCLRPVRSCDGGYFEIEVPETDRCVSGAVMRIFPFSGRYATTYCDIELGTDTPDFTVAESFTVYATEAPTTLPPLGDASAERTVVFAGGIEVDVTPERFFPTLVDYEEFSSRVIAATDPAPCGTATQNFDGIVAFGNEGNIQDVFDVNDPDSFGTGPGFPVRIPAGGLTEGTVVDLFVLGGLDCREDNGDLVKEGEWLSFGTGTVQASGMIEGGVMPCFNWLAWRVR